MYGCCEGAVFDLLNVLALESPEQTQSMKIWDVGPWREIMCPEESTARNSGVH